MNGFVITVSCEEFFEDARKSVAIFFHQDRMKTVEDLKERLKSLVRNDFNVLWSPQDEENYYYLLNDEKLHFVKPKDKFRICKLSKSSTKLFNDTNERQISNIEENIRPPKLNGVELVDSNHETNRTSNENAEPAESNHATNGIYNESTKNILSEDLMEYEDVVDQGTKKKRKRTRTHKSKKQKLENSTTINSETVPLTNSVQSTNDQVFTFNSVKQNGKSHIRFQTELSSNDQVDSEQRSNDIEIIQLDNMENFETVKKKKNKSKKKQRESSFETSYQCNDQVQKIEFVGSPSVPSSSTVDEPSELISLNSSTTNMVTSTAANSPISLVHKSPKRKRNTQSLARFITTLSESLKHPSKSNDLPDNIHDVSVIKKTNQTSCNSNKRSEKLSPDIINQVNSVDSQKTLCQNVNDNETAPVNNMQYTDRKLKNKLKTQCVSPQVQTNHDSRAVLDSLKQWKHSNFPNMPLVFERKSSHTRNCASRENGIQELASESEISTVGETLKHDLEEQEDEAGVMATNGFSDVQQAVSCIKTMTDLEKGAFPVLKDPKETDVILFKVLKMDESYSPNLSHYVCGEIKSICKITSQLSLHILHGAAELKPPKGKFSLEDEEISEEEISEHSINWNELYESRLLVRRENF